MVSYDDIRAKNYSLSAGQYFEVKVDYTDITQKQFEGRLRGFEERLSELFSKSKKLGEEIQDNLKSIG